MFTGLVDDIGTIDRVRTTDAGRELTVRCGYQDLQAGESIALNGVCLTVRDPAPGSFTCAAVTTTIDLTAIGTWAAGTRVNLERALRVGDRLGGHFVQGHVDGVAKVVRTHTDGDALVIDLAPPAEVADLMVERGSVTVDGVSLTIHGVDEGQLRVSIIEFTRTHTTLGELRAGDSVHIEADIIAKHVRRLLGSATLSHDS
jgi:riboflavin synthase